MSAATLAESRTKSAIKDYEAETGVPVAGNTKLEQVFGYLHQIYLAHAILGEMKFRRELPTGCASGKCGRW